MTTELRQLGPEEHPSGTAALRITGPGAQRFGDPEAVTIAIVEPGQTERFLNPNTPEDPWVTTVVFFRPFRPQFREGGLWLEIDHGISYHLGANKPYRLRLRSTDGVEVEEVFAMRGNMRRPSQRPKGWTPPPDPTGPLQAPLVEAAPEPAPPPPAPAPVQEPVADWAAAPAEAVVTQAPPAPEPYIAPPPPAPKPGLPKWVVPLVVLLLLAAGAAGWFLFGRTSEPQWTMDSCRKHLQGSPEALAARTQAEKMAKAGQLLDCQFLLMKYAAEKGDVVAARVLGVWYDPDTWSKDKSPLPAPNPAQASTWHAKAAAGGDAEAMYRYGMLLKLGRTEEPDGPEKAQVWLRKAADAGHPLAKDALK